MTSEELYEKQLRRGRGFRDLLDATADLLFRHNPIPDDKETKPDEYKLEAQQIVGQLRGCKSEADVSRLVHKVFLTWRGGDAGTLGRYDPIGRDLWKLWGEHSNS